MNKTRRQNITKIMMELKNIIDNLSDILDDEQMYYDNIPENLLGSERAEISEESIELIEEAINNLEEVIGL